VKAHIIFFSGEIYLTPAPHAPPAPPQTAPAHAPHTRQFSNPATPHNCHVRCTFLLVRDTETGRTETRLPWPRRDAPDLLLLREESNSRQRWTRHPAMVSSQPPPPHRCPRQIGPY
jgi:hypothetical protein